MFAIARNYYADSFDSSSIILELISERFAVFVCLGFFPGFGEPSDVDCKLVPEGRAARERKI